MRRKDYKKMMEQKKRSKLYAKATVVGAVGLSFFGLTTQARAEEWKANSVEQIKESIKESKDGVYIIKTGDTLSGISEATGITIDTLAKVNSIKNIDLIYAGDKLIIKTEEGKVALVDEQNNVKNEVPLSKKDKEGIKEVQKQDTNNVYSNNSTNVNNNGSNTNIGGETEKPEEPGTGGETEKPEEPGTGGETEKPEEPGTGGETEKPEEPGTGGETEKPEEPVWVPEQVIPEQGHWEDGVKEVWVPNIVTIVDKPAYTETMTYTLITFAADGKQFKITANINTPEGQAQYQAVLDHSDWLDEQGLPNNNSTRVVTEEVTHPAVTHTEDHGSYQTVPDPDNQVWVVDVPEQVIPGHWA